MAFTTKVLLLTQVIGWVSLFNHWTSAILPEESLTYVLRVEPTDERDEFSFFCWSSQCCSYQRDKLTTFLSDPLNLSCSNGRFLRHTVDDGRLPQVWRLDVVSNIIMSWSHDPRRRSVGTFQAMTANDCWEASALVSRLGITPTLLPNYTPQELKIPPVCPTEWSNKWEQLWFRTRLRSELYCFKLYLLKARYVVAWQAFHRNKGS
jgi:hypothetical protein